MSYRIRHPFQFPLRRPHGAPVLPLPLLPRCIPARKIQQRARYAFGLVHGLCRGDADDQTVRCLPIDAVVSRPQELIVLPPIGSLQLFQEPCHFVCLIVVIFCGTRVASNARCRSSAAGRPAGSYALRRAPCGGNPAAIELQCLAARAARPVRRAGCDGHDRTQSPEGAVRGHSTNAGHGFHTPFSLRGLPERHAPTQTASAFATGGTIRRGTATFRLFRHPPGGKSSGRGGYSVLFSPELTDWNEWLR